MGVRDFDVDSYCDRIERVLDFLGWYADNADIEGEDAKLATIKSEIRDLTDQTKQLKALFRNRELSIPDECIGADEEETE